MGLVHLHVGKWKGKKPDTYFTSRLKQNKSGETRNPRSKSGEVFHEAKQMNENFVSRISEELNYRREQIMAAVQLLDEGGTVPFIARYRKEATGSLDEVVLSNIRDRMAQLEELSKRRESILKSLQERELLSEDLKEKIVAAETMTTLEDIYLPFRPKRRTRATIAKEKGLEELAVTLFAQKGETDPHRGSIGLC